MSASSMPWVKMYTEMLDDPKVGRLNETTRWRFVQMILMAGECDAEGYLVSGKGPLSLEDIAWRLRLNAQKLDCQLKSLASVGLMESTDKGWRVCKFSNRQGRSQSEKREIWRKRQAVTRDSRVSHAPRVEEEKRKSKRESKTLGADKPPQHPAILAYREAARYSPDPSQKKAIEDTIGESPDALAYWKQVVSAYCLNGWNKRNVANMLDFFKRHELPPVGKGGKVSGAVGPIDTETEYRRLNAHLLKGKTNDL